jgi:hypothetical protein
MNHSRNLAAILSANLGRNFGVISADEQKCCRPNYRRMA